MRQLKNIGKRGCAGYIVELLQDIPYLIEDEAPDEKVLGDIYYILGNAYYEKEDYSNAASALKTAVSYDPGNSLYHRDYAAALAETGNTARAEEVLYEAVRLGLGEDSIYMVQGEIAFVEMRYEVASESLLKAAGVTLDTELKRRAVLLCDRDYRALGADCIDADISLLEDEIASGSDGTQSFVIHERLADAYASKAASAEGSDAEIYYKKSLEEFLYLYGNGYVTFQLMENIAIIYEAIEDFDEAVSILVEMAERWPDDYVPYMRLAYLEADRQQLRENK